MKLAVIGATGRTGTLLVDELLHRGHDLSVLARTPEKLGPRSDRVRVVTGSSTDPAALEDLLTGEVDAVVSALGPTTKEPDLHTRTARALIEVMGAHGVRRFVGISGAGVDVPDDQKGRRDTAISFLIRRLGGAIAADKAQEYEAFADSDLDFTLVRPPRLVDGPATGRFVHDAHRPGRSSSLRRADLASCVADFVEQGSYPRLAPFVSAA